MTAKKHGRAKLNPKTAKSEEYHPHIVTFLDVLGFRELVSGRTASEVAAVLALVRRFSGAEGQDQGRYYEPRVIAFSDSIVRLRRVDTPLNKRLPIGLPFHELIDLVHVQGELIVKGVLVRGAVTYGDALVEGSQVFGPGVIDAYDLASQFGRYPRIVVSPRLLRAMGTDPRLKAKHHSFEEEQAEYIYPLLRLGDDGIWFIDYLRVFADELDDPSMYYDVLKIHRDLIRSGGHAARGVTNAGVKYSWLSRYHNSILDAGRREWFRAYGTTRKDLKIGPDDLPAFYDPSVRHTRGQARGVRQGRRPR